MRKSVTLALALLGLFDSLYLLWTYTTPSRPMVCLGTGCDAVRASIYSHVAGMPMPLFGVAGYLLLALLIIVESLVSPPLALEVRYAFAGAAGFGFLFSLYLEYLQTFVIHAYCAWCVTSGIVMTLLCALAVYNVVRPAPEPDAPAQLAQVRKYYVVSVAALLIGVPSFYELSAHGHVPPPPPSPSEASAALLVRPDSHATGNPQAAVTVVEFGDFECPVCGSEALVVRALRAKYGSQVRFVFRQFPLVHIHPFAERMAEASECAAEQGKFWEAVDAIYARQDDLSEAGLQQDAAAIGLDMGKFKQCMASGSTAPRVRQDVQDGKALGVVGTPTFFVGRQVLPDVPNFEGLSRAIDRELAARQSAPPSGASSSATPYGTESSSPRKNHPARRTESQPPAVAPAQSEPAASSFGLLGSSAGSALSGFQSGEVGCSEAEAAKKQPELIETRQLKDILAGNSKPLFVDVRPAKDYAAAHIPGAINIPIAEMANKWQTLPKDHLIVFYQAGGSGDICASGRSAGRTLLEHGYSFDLVKVYKDGLAGWQSSGLSTNK